MSRLAAAVGALALVALSAGPLPAQVAPPEARRGDTAVVGGAGIRAGPTRAAAARGPAGLPPAQGARGGPDRISPLGAFLRNMALPGWGHAAVGAYGRGGFYFAADAGIVWMLLKTISSLESAEERAELRVSAARRRLRREGITDPDSLEAAVDEVQAVQDARSLVEARSQQREDWIALGVFFLLLGGADAFVSAHLADIPPPLGIVPGPAGSVEVRADVPVTLFGSPPSRRSGRRRP